MFNPKHPPLFFLLTPLPLAFLPKSALEAKNDSSGWPDRFTKCVQPSRSHIGINEVYPNIRSITVHTTYLHTYEFGMYIPFKTFCSSTSMLSFKSNYWYNTEVFFLHLLLLLVSHFVNAAMRYGHVIWKRDLKK